jgi:hypothetical protein
VHDVFHVSQLKNCLQVPEEQMPLEGLTIGEDLMYQEYPVKILDTSEKTLFLQHVFNSAHSFLWPTPFLAGTGPSRQS